MQQNVLIVEDEFIIANDLRLLLEHSGFTVSGIAASVPEARDLLPNHPVDIVLLDIYLKGELTGIDLAHELRDRHLPFVYLSANSNQQVLELVKETDPAGFLIKPFREKDVLVTLDIARYKHAERRKTGLAGKGSSRLAIQELATSQTQATIDWQHVLQAIRHLVPFDFATMTVCGSEGRQDRWKGWLRAGFSEYQELGTAELAVVTRKPESELHNLTMSCRVEKMPSVALNDASALAGRDALRALLARQFSLESELSFPVFTEDGCLLSLSFFSRTTAAYHPEDIVQLIAVQQSLRMLCEKYCAAAPPANASLHNDIPAGLREETPATGNALDGVMKLLAQVAPTDTSVLILGESGTGKERIADRLHRLSPRAGKPLVKINCAALPANLVESELFGHEKGAFTGATERKQGKFELANGGTIFLDEIGEMSLDQQVKLLRVLQEREVERIGGTQRIKLNVRVIAATNRILEKEVAEGRFRLDLFYRLNVFPIQLPPLRERVADIPQLAALFAKDFCRKMNKAYAGISPEAMAQLQSYSWPGNVRELENILEQAVILNDGQSPIALRRPLTNLPASPSHEMKSLDAIQALHRQNERAYIAAVLRQTRGRIRGTGGAAELLQEKPTTLESRMQKLGIRKEEFLD